MTLTEFDFDAMEREGFIPVNCPNPKCGRTLAMQSADGNTLQINRNASTSAPQGRVYLKCACGSRHTWRPSQGKKTEKPSISRQSLKNP